MSARGVATSRVNEYHVEYVVTAGNIVETVAFDYIYVLKFQGFGIPKSYCVGMMVKLNGRDTLGFFCKMKSVNAESAGHVQCPYAVVNLFGMEFCDSIGSRHFGNCKRRTPEIFTN